MLTDGQEVDRYVVECLLGAGGMASVYRVRHRTLGTRHALKLLTLSGPRLVERFVQEGQVQARLRHPHVVAVTDVFDVGGSPGLLMEFVDGPSLDRRVARGPLPNADAERVFRGILAGVAFAHAEGVIHRDLKPANVLLADGVPKVADFGLARVLADFEVGERHTRSGTAMGTPSYMAPEQVRDARGVDERADIWSLGCILYELHTGRRPFDGPDVLAIFNAVVNGGFVPLERLRPDLPPRWGVLVRACLEIDRDRRIPDCDALRGLLDAPSPAWVGPTLTPGGDTFPGPGAGPGDMGATLAAVPSAIGPAAPVSARDREAAETPPSLAGDPGEEAPRAPGLGWRIGAVGAVVAAILVAVLAGTREAAETDVPVPAEPAGVPLAPPVDAAAPATLPLAAPPATEPTPPPIAAAHLPGSNAAPPTPSAVAPRAPAAPSAVAAPSPAAARVGTLKVNSIPWSAVSVDGAPVSRGAWSGEVAAGTHAVELRTAEGAVHRASVSVSDGTVSNLCWNFELDAACLD